MARFGSKSKARLSTCDPRLIVVMERCVEAVDLTILCGHRTQEAQQRALQRGRTTKRWPNSRHNAEPSTAVDFAPWLSTTPHIDWRTDVELWRHTKDGDDGEADVVLENIKRWFAIVNFIVGVGKGMGIELRSGGDWDRDFRFNDHRLIDLPHIELVEL